MDLSRFLGKRRELLFWIAGPVLLIVTFSTIFTTHFNSAKNSIDKSKIFIELQPVIEQKISVAKTILQAYSVSSSEIDSIKMLDLELNQLAVLTKFTIDSLAVEKVTQKNKKNKGSVFKATLSGKGPLPAVIDFLNKTFISDKIFMVENATMSMVNLEGKSFYNVKLVFLYFTLSQE